MTAGTTRTRAPAAVGCRAGLARRAVRGPPRSRTQRILGRHPLLSILGILAALTVTFISLTAYAAYRNVYDSIHHLDVTNHMLGNRPPKLDGSTNILIIGSDSRTGTKGKYGRGIDGSRSDTSMLLHIPPNHNGALVVSFPRDTMVPIYQCDADGSGHQASRPSPSATWSSSTGPTPTAARPACGRPWSRSPTFTSTTSSRSTSSASGRSSMTSAGSPSACPTPSRTRLRG